MKATDLMIGDWVMRGNIVSEPMKVTEIIPYKDYVCMDFAGLAVAAKFSQINPIPITPEILELNGWYYDDLDGEWCGCGFRIGGYNPEEYTILDGRTISYVHELQHFLRDCKINKEIIL